MGHLGSSAPKSRLDHSDADPQSNDTHIVLLATHCKLIHTKKEKKVLVNFAHVNGSGPKKIAEHRPHPFKSGLSPGNNGGNIWTLEPVSGAIERPAAGSDAVN